MFADNENSICKTKKKKITGANANEDLFDLTVKIDGWVLRSLHCCDER